VRAVVKFSAGTIWVPTGIKLHPWLVAEFMV